MVATFSLVGCTQKAAETTDTQKAAETTEAVEEEGVEGVVEAEPKLGEGMVIYMQMAGLPGLPDTDPKIFGAQTAADSLGVKLVMQFANWDTAVMVAQFKEAIAAQPDAIIINGMPGEEAMRPLVEEAFNDGIIISSNHIGIPAFEKEFKAKGYGYVGLEFYGTGYAQADNAIKSAGLKKGDRVLIYGYKTIPSLAPLSIGAEDRFKEEGLIVDYIDITDEVYTDPVNAIPILAGYFAANPDCKAMVLWHGILTAASGELLAGAGLKPGDIFLSGCDLGPKTVEALEAGWVSAIGDQMLYLQGFYSLTHVVLVKAYGFPGFVMNIVPDFITKKEIGEIKKLVEKNVR